MYGFPKHPKGGKAQFMKGEAWVRETRQRLREYRDELGEPGASSDRWELAEEAEGEFTSARSSFARVRLDLQAKWALFEPQRYVKFVFGRPVLAPPVVSHKCSCSVAKTHEHRTPWSPVPTPAIL